jgi:hypothetical protein
VEIRPIPNPVEETIVIRFPSSMPAAGKTPVCVLLVVALLTAFPASAAPGFDAAGSDARAVEIADATMAAMGGADAWARTRFVAWNFFGRRHLLWDRHRGMARVEFPASGADPAAVVVTSVQAPEGRAWLGGRPVTDPEALTDLLRRGHATWINDSYWLVMPYKLKDPGVTLRYVGTAAMADGRDAEVLELTFRDVGLTPQNKYRVYVAADSGLVEQWDFYGTADQTEPNFSTPWHDWKRYGEILLSGDRGERDLTDIEVLDDVPLETFESPEPVYLAATE